MFILKGLKLTLAKPAPIKKLQLSKLSRFHFSTCCSMYQQQGYNSDKSPIEIKKDPQYDTINLLTIPNLLTSSRIVLTPAIGYFIYNGMSDPALLCFTFAALTDIFDGFVARRFKQRSQLGAIIDPIADKLLMTTSFVALSSVGIMPAWLVGGFIGRDVALMFGGSLLRSACFQGKRPTISQFLDFNKYPMPEFRPTLISKCNTALQCSLIFLHLGASQLIGLEVSDSKLLGLDIITACTTAVSFGQYLARQLFSEKSTRYRL